MWLQFLGTGDAFCSGGRYQTCFLTRISGYCFLIDCGATSLMALKARDIDSNQLDGIIITHFHGDHYGGVPFLLLDAHVSKKRARPLSILGPVGVAARVGALMDKLYPKVDVNNLSFPVEFYEFAHSGNNHWGPLTVESYPVVHVPESQPHGIRIIAQEGVLSFSGDTGWTENLYHISKSADLFICECNFYRTMAPAHLNYQTIMDERKRLQGKRIILNHMGPEMLENLDAVSLECSYDGLIVEI